MTTELLNDLTARRQAARGGWQSGWYEPERLSPMPSLFGELADSEVVEIWNKRMELNANAQTEARAS